MNERDDDPAVKLQHLATRLIRMARSPAGEGGITSSQYSAMAVLNDKGAISLVALARLEGVSHPTMSRIVAGLVRAGHVTRSANPADKRSQLLELSDEGRDLYLAKAERRIALFRMLLSRLSPATVAEIVEAMKDLSDATAGDLRRT